MTPTAFEFLTPPDEPVITYHRHFRAPPALVFRAWTEPDLVKRWWGPRMMELVVCEIDLRVGGRFRYVLRAPNGQEFGCHGEYQQVDAPHCIVTTFVLDDAPENEAIETFTFEAVEGGTRLTGTTRHQSIAARDQHSANGMMEAGLADACQRLDELLDSLGEA